jgi:alpha-L-fucosidase
MRKKIFILIVAACALPGRAAVAQPKSLSRLQQEFVDLRFGMFIHYNIPTYMPDDWADPDASPDIFNPLRLDCSQWAKAAKAANMSYGCLTTKHHSGFCIWDTKTTAYSVMSSPYKKDVVREFVDAFRAEGLKVMLYFSILDTHHQLRPQLIAPHHIEMVREQLRELLTGYGEIAALVIDGWDAPWSRISYDEVPFEDIYLLVKSIQPNCLVMDLNAAKYPAEALFYTDIKSYEQGAGQNIYKEGNKLPALSCLPINSSWFWKESFPKSPVKAPEDLVYNNIIPLNSAFCSFILNVAPNRDGRIDDNAVAALRRIGALWKNQGAAPALPPCEAPIISPNIAKHKPSFSSWSSDMSIMDFANNDRFDDAWHSNAAVKDPWYEVAIGNSEQPFNMVVLTEGGSSRHIRRYRLEYYAQGLWKPLYEGENTEKVKIHRFRRVWGSKVRIAILKASGAPAIAELGVYNERREN